MSRTFAPAVDKLARQLGYQFEDDGLRRQALTHRSAHGEHNERLEFLGDALLGMLIAEHLYATYPQADEGQLTRTRASLVNREALADIARELELGEHLVLGEGEQKSGGWRRDSILANAFEALLGAVYLDGGIGACRDCVRRVYAARLTERDPHESVKDAKTALQEYLQARRLALPRYETTDIDGPPHEQVFTVRCEVDALPHPVCASGRSRRKAEQAAARAALKQLRS